MDDNILYKEISYEIVAAAIDVWKNLGYGFLEKVYENALMIELRKRKIRCRSSAVSAVLISRGAGIVVRLQTRCAGIGVHSVQHSSPRAYGRLPDAGRREANKPKSRDCKLGGGLLNFP